MYKFIPILLLLSGCTIANVDVQAGTLDFYTFATSRKDIVITRGADGSITWATRESNPEIEALANMSATVAKLAGAVVVP